MCQLHNKRLYEKNMIFIGTFFRTDKNILTEKIKNDITNYNVAKSVCIDSFRKKSDYSWKQEK